MNSYSALTKALRVDGVTTALVNPPTVIVKIELTAPASTAYGTPESSSIPKVVRRNSPFPPAMVGGNLTGPALILIGY